MGNWCEHQVSVGAFFRKKGGRLVWVGGLEAEQRTVERMGMAAITTRPCCKLKPQRQYCEPAAANGE